MGWRHRVMVAAALLNVSRRSTGTRRQRGDTLISLTSQGGRRSRRFASVACLCLLAACQSQSSAAPKAVGTVPVLPTPVSGEYVTVGGGAFKQPFSGFVFPEVVGTFKRRSEVRSFPDGSYVAVDYVSGDLPKAIVVTIYAYPMIMYFSALENADRACREVFAKEKNILLYSHQNVRTVREGPEPDPWHSARLGYRRIVTSDGLRTMADKAAIPGPIGNELHLFCDPSTGWHTKYRVTYPQGFNARARVDEFLSLAPQL